MPTMHKGQKYRCQNRDCQALVEVIESSIEVTEGRVNEASNSSDEILNLRCRCGSEMKQLYTPPLLKRLEKDDPRVHRLLSEQFSRQ